VTSTDLLSKGDELVERGARYLEQVARDFSRDGGAKAKLADELAEDADFLRRLKPTLIAARIRGEAPTAEEPRSAPSRPPAGVPQPEPEQATARPAAQHRSRGPKTGGPNPFAVLAVALAVGIMLAKIVDWRGHAHPRA
jgi:hypothetical protein